MIWWASNVCQKNHLTHWILLEKSIVFFVQIKVISKIKKQDLHWYFFSKLRWSQKKKVISTQIVPFIFYFLTGFQKKRKGREKGVCLGMMNILGGQNCPKYPKNKKLPKICGALPAPHLLRHCVLKSRTGHFNDLQALRPRTSNCFLENVFKDYTSVKKAFDSVSHEILFFMIFYDRYDILGPCKIHIASFHANKTQCD